MFSIRSKHVLAASACSRPEIGRLHRQLVDVGAGDERLLTRAGQDDDAHRIVLLQVEDDAPELVERRQS